MSLTVNAIYVLLVFGLFLGLIAGWLVYLLWFAAIDLPLAERLIRWPRLLPARRYDAASKFLRATFEERLTWLAGQSLTAPEQHERRVVETWLRHWAEQPVFKGNFLLRDRLFLTLVERRLAAAEDIILADDSSSSPEQYLLSAHAKLGHLSHWCEDPERSALRYRLTRLYWAMRWLGYSARDSTACTCGELALAHPASSINNPGDWNLLFSFLWGHPKSIVVIPRIVQEQQVAWHYVDHWAKSQYPKLAPSQQEPFIRWCHDTFKLDFKYQLHLVLDGYLMRHLFATAGRLAAAYVPDRLVDIRHQFSIYGAAHDTGNTFDFTPHASGFNHVEGNGLVDYPEET